MKTYFDTSVVVTLTLQEAQWSELTRWIIERTPSPYFSDFGWGEYVSAVGLKVRRGELGVAETHETIAAINDYLKTWRRLRVPRSDLVEAAQMVSSFNLALRFPDAIHIASAKRAGCALVSGENKQVAAARHFGVETFNPYDK